MANRPVYISLLNDEIFTKADVEFKYFSGFSIAQKQRSIESLHQEVLKKNPERKILEISSKSKEPLGVSISAFNLSLTTRSGKRQSVEVLFQGSKVFEKGGPYVDIFDLSSREAKKDLRLKNSGNIIGFNLYGKQFPCEPKTLFYNWLYINTLNLNKELSEQVLQYDAFTDIEFNPKKSINCQAEAAAIFVSLSKQGLLSEALLSKENFTRIVYGDKEKKMDIELFE